MEWRKIFTRLESKWNLEFKGFNLLHFLNSSRHSRHHRHYHSSGIVFIGNNNNNNNIYRPNQENIQILAISLEVSLIEVVCVDF